MERAKDGKGLDRWLRMDRKKRREEAARLATLAELGARVEAILRCKPSDDRRDFEQIEKAARELGLLPDGESK